MRAKSYSEVKELLSSSEFSEWWETLRREVAAQETAADKLHELLTQANLMGFRAELGQQKAAETLYQAGECEDAAAKHMAEAQDLENRSFEVVAAFEEQRLKVSDIWYRLGALDKSIAELREKLRDRSSNPRTGSEREKRKGSGVVGDLEAQLRKVERDHRQVHADYDRETQRKFRLWDEVERIWSSSTEMNLLASEKRVEFAKVRQRAERLFREAEDRKERAKGLRAEADEQRTLLQQLEGRQARLLLSAQERFGCAAGSSFLYFRQREQQNGAYGLALIADAESYNIEVKALGLYRLDRQRGVEFLEPALEPSDGDEGRFERFFLGDRRLNEVGG